MKTHALPDRHIATPWLGRAEAAAYCGLSLSTFDAWTRGWVPGGTARHRRWHVDILDKWIRGELPDRPFGPPVKPVHKPRRRARRSGAGAVITLTDPVTGRTVSAKEAS